LGLGLLLGRASVAYRSDSRRPFPGEKVANNDECPAPPAGAMAMATGRGHAAGEGVRLPDPVRMPRAADAL
jgi:hypothetical protein